MPALRKKYFIRSVGNGLFLFIVAGISPVIIEGGRLIPRELAFDLIFFLLAGFLFQWWSDALDANSSPILLRRRGKYFDSTRYEPFHVTARCRVNELPFVRHSDCPRLSMRSAYCRYTYI